MVEYEEWHCRGPDKGVVMTDHIAEPGLSSVGSAVSPLLLFQTEMDYRLASASQPPKVSTDQGILQSLHNSARLSTFDAKGCN